MTTYHAQVALFADAQLLRAPPEGNSRYLTPILDMRYHRFAIWQWSTRVVPADNVVLAWDWFRTAQPIENRFARSDVGNIPVPPLSGTYRQILPDGSSVELTSTAVRDDVWVPANDVQFERLPGGPDGLRSGDMQLNNNAYSGYVGLITLGATALLDLSLYGSLLRT